MAAYLIVEVEVTDPVAYEAYKPLAGASVARHGGKFIVRGGKTQSMEGGWDPKRIVVLEFPSMDAAKAFYDSPDYQEALKIRLATSRSKAILVEGA
jgi:uncharacterized protein (DUF1330 family)